MQVHAVFVLPGHPSIPIGGYRVVYEYANYFVSQGHLVTIIHAGALRQHKDPLTPKALVGRFRIWQTSKASPPVSWQKVDSRVTMLYLPGEPVEARIPDCDVVVATSWETAEYVAGYPSRLGRKYYLIQHFEQWNANADRVQQTWRLPLNKVVVSRWLQELGAGWGIPGLVHIPNGIDFRRFHITTPPHQREAAILSLYHEAQWKGSRDALIACEIIHAWNPSVEVTFFGQGPRGKDIPAWIPYVENPSQEQLVDLYNEHTIYASASWAEGWALPPAEAIACGMVFVGTDSGGCRDYAIHDVTALLSPPRDPEALAANLKLALTDAVARERIRSLGYTEIQNFTWERSGRQLLDYLLQEQSD